MECWVAVPSRSIGDAIPQLIMLPMNGSPAVWGEAYGPVGTRQPEGSPVTLNLATGENLWLVIEREDGVGSQLQYEGRILADLADGGTVVLADGVTYERQPIPG